MAVTLRPYTDGDLPAVIEIVNRIFPDEPRSLETARHEEKMWDASKFFRHRLVAVEENGQVVGRGNLTHLPWQFQADKYGLWLDVDPAHQRQGVGTMLYDALLAVAQERKAVLLRAGAKESLPHSHAFLQHRGFEEIQRAWDSHLDVEQFDLVPFASAEPRVEQQGVVMTTLAAEGKDDERVLRGVYALDKAGSADEPAYEPITPAPYEIFLLDLAAPNALPEAYFLAKDGDRYVGLSALWKNLALPHVLQQGFTCVLPEYRGRGIAMALKIRGVRYAKEHGYKEIRTGNNTRNRPMLRINEAMGFVKQPVWIEYGKPL